MDIIIPLLLMALLYLGPALLKRYDPTKNIQPRAPEPANFDSVNASPTIKKIPSYRTSDTPLHASVVADADKRQSVPTIVKEQSAWDGKLDTNMITNGVIFAEILQPPRAYRPFIRRTK